MKIKPVSLFGKKPENSTIEFIRPFSGYKKEIFKARENGKINPFPHLSYESPVGYFERCIVLGGMYPFDPIGHFWYGTTYFQSGLELPNFQGLAPISLENLDKLGLSKNWNELETFKKVVLIHGRDNFGHFLFEIIGKFFLVKNLVDSDYTYLVSDDIPDRFLDYLALLGVPKKKITKYPKFTTFVAEKIIVPAVSAHRHPKYKFPSLDNDLFKRMTSEIIDYAKASSSQESKTKKTSSGLFIGREKEKWRRLENEEDVRSVAKNFFSFDLLNPASLDPSNQVLSFNHADIVFAVAGGANPTVMFCKPGTIVIELIPPDFRGDWGMRIWCALLNLNYWRVTGEYSDHHVNLGSLPIDRDFGISLEYFRKTMDSVSENLSELYLERIYT